MLTLATVGSGDYRSVDSGDCRLGVGQSQYLRSAAASDDLEGKKVTSPVKNGYSTGKSWPLNKTPNKNPFT